MALLLTFYGDDFTGSTDALEQLTLAGVRAALFIAPPTKQQLSRFKNLQAVGIAGKTRSLTPEAMKRELVPAFQALKKLGARHVHYKVCSTFDSSPETGSIGCVMDLAGKIFPASFIPLLVAAPALGRYTIFGNHYARFGIGSAGEIYRLDRHPSISKHPVTPMTEADLQMHLAKQTKKKVALFDVLKISRPEKEMRVAFKKLLAEKPDVILFDAVDEGHLKKIGDLIDGFADGKRSLFSVGSSGIEMALTACRRSSRGDEAPFKKSKINKSFRTSTATNVLIGSGSCSPVTSAQIARALKSGFAEVAIDAGKLLTQDAIIETQRAANSAVEFLRSGRSVIVHTTKSGSDKRLASKLKGQTAAVLGTVLGTVLRGALLQTKVQRLCVAGGDTSSFAARALGIEALEMIAPLTPGAPLCRAFAPGSPADKLEVVFKGGQVGAENYFETVLRGKL